MTTAYRHRSSNVDAFRIGHDNEPSWWAVAISEGHAIAFNEGSTLIRDGFSFDADKGNWIVREPSGLLYAFAPQEFEALFEPVPGATD